MASSSSSLRFPSSLPNPNSQNLRKNLTFTLNSLPPRNLRTSDEKSLAVATGEVFLNLASRLINRRRSSENSSVATEGGVVWEQRNEDVEAERERLGVMTSPGFSFSAAGLLFPYHLGVAQFLIEKGYIKVHYHFIVCTLYY